MNVHLSGPYLYLPFDLLCSVCFENMFIVILFLFLLCVIIVETVSFFVYGILLITFMKFELCMSLYSSVARLNVLCTSGRLCYHMEL